MMHKNIAIELHRLPKKTPGNPLPRQKEGAQ